MKRFFVLLCVTLVALDAVKARKHGGGHGDRDSSGGHSDEGNHHKKQKEGMEGGTCVNDMYCHSTCCYHAERTCVDNCYCTGECGTPTPDRRGVRNPAREALDKFNAKKQGRNFLYNPNPVGYYGPHAGANALLSHNEHYLPGNLVP